MFARAFLCLCLFVYILCVYVRAPVNVCNRVLVRMCVILMYVFECLCNMYLY